MPEIDFCLFDLSKIFIFFPRENKELRQRVLEYEKKAQVDMEENRWKLFNEFGYGCQYIEDRYLSSAKVKISFSALENNSKELFSNNKSQLRAEI